eukprot:CAMPEP_0201480798 /NCGR_PEP_ID=MMETSP0151_2-20130828/5207_1 /ASSEMBLY_ACC=CAM_ASM_000257 /TAXON_ID=200890 /ORGANISM="Paramoeba atlantica, Strain 621/1 / CCAP 1560/9" /LENGTH=210 /DNA_ID=CAMNT_0047862767 /DNA_START=212 /DNA_END=844 /DNA_ORIENTATION=-
MTSVIGVAALSFCCYQVYLLTALSERLEDYAKQNKALKETNVKLTQNVDTFMKQNADLKRITDELAQENGKFKGQVDNLGSTLKNLEVVSQTIEAFGAETQGDLSSILTNLKETLDGQKEVVKKQEGILSTTEQATNSQEKMLLMTLHQQCQFLDKSMGLSREEFQTFLTMIPEKFRQGDVSFDSLDANKDGTIDVTEFQGIVNQLVEAY